MDQKRMVFPETIFCNPEFLRFLRNPRFLPDFLPFLEKRFRLRGMFRLVEESIKDFD